MNNSNLFWCKTIISDFPQLTDNGSCLFKLIFFYKKIISDKFMFTMLNYHYYVSLAQ